MVWTGTNLLGINLYTAFTTWVQNTDRYNRRYCILGQNTNLCTVSFFLKEGGDTGSDLPGLFLKGVHCDIDLS